MDVKVINPFTDRENGRIYLPEDMFSGSTARISELVEKGFLQKAEAKPRKKQPADK